MAALSGVTPNGLVYGSTIDAGYSPAYDAVRDFFSAPASAVWPSADLGIAVPYLLNGRILIKRLWIANGATVGNGQSDVAIYDRSFNRLIAATAATTAGTGTLQYFDVTDTWVGPGLIYIASVMQSGTDTALRLAANSISYLRRAGVVQMAAARPMPATFVPATVTTTYVPVAGFTTRASP